MIGILFTLLFNLALSDSNQGIESLDVNIIEQNSNHVIIEYLINDFTLNEVEINNEIFHTLYLNDEPNFIISKMPSLPHINRSLIIPDHRSINITVIDQEFSEYSNINIIPSKGNLKRNIDISTIPYEKDMWYSQNTYFPGNLYEVTDPYILRDFRGQVVQINPFQFNAYSSTLKVYSKITIKVEFDGMNMNNIYTNRLNEDKITKDYSYIYSDRFLNFSTHQTRYSQLLEDGEMLVICYDSFCDKMAPFVNWKNQKGIKTTLVPKSSAGTSATSIKNYVQNFYSTHNLSYLLLVGDKDQIPTFEVGSGMSGGESDISYAYISGNDSYPEFFVGRFSAQNTSHVQTAVERSIAYERDPQQNATWYKHGMFIASNEGSGNGHDGGESDWQHAQNMRSDLLNYYYTDVAEMYDGSHGGQDSSGNPSDSMIRNEINQGLGIIHYTGHGDTDVWVTSNFNTGDVNSLTNTNELPFVCTVGCKSGDFGDGTCLGEEFLRSTTGSNPTGAIATFMSTIYQGWAPPMEAQDEMVDILTEGISNNRKYSFGGISWNGCLEMNDNYGSDGDSETDHWTLFGDPSIELRTNTPSNLSISHTGLISPEDGVYEVIINGEHDNVIAALSSDGMYLGSAYSDNGSSIIIVNEDISALSSVTLTVTGYNTLTVIENVLVGSACTGYVNGDMNGDSISNVQDIVLMVNIVLGLINFDDCQLEYGDLNADQIFNILDIVSLVSIILD